MFRMELGFYFLKCAYCIEVYRKNIIIMYTVRIKKNNQVHFKFFIFIYTYWYLGYFTICLINNGGIALNLLSDYKKKNVWPGNNLIIYTLKYLNYALVCFHFTFFILHLVADPYILPGVFLRISCLHENIFLVGTDELKARGGNYPLIWNL